MNEVLCKGCSVGFDNSLSWIYSIRSLWSYWPFNIVVTGFLGISTKSLPSFSKILQNFENNNWDFHSKLSALKLCENHLKHQRGIMSLIKVNSVLGIFQVFGPSCYTTFENKIAMLKKTCQWKLVKKVC